MLRNTSRARRQLGVAGGVLAAALLLAACGNGSGDTTSTGSESTEMTHSAGAGGQGLSTAKTSAGTVLVDAKGMTLYAFAADSPGTSNCSGSCTQYWPPERASGSVSHSSDVTAKLGTISRSDGSMQLTVNGWPAYTYASDSPGQASGQGLNLSGGLWWAFAPSGSQIKSGGSSSSGGGVRGY